MPGVPEIDVAAHRWLAEGRVYNAFGAALRRRFGGRVQRVSLDAGFTCPNVDGAVARGGCNFCDNRSFSPSRRLRLASVGDQLRGGIEAVRARFGNVVGFIAYLQPATNTYAPLEQLEQLYRAALAASPEIVGLAIGTRPDCVPDAVLDLIDSLAADRYVSVEYGMQTMHDRSLRWMNRGHDHASMLDAMHRSRGRRFETSVHIMLGIPGESHADMMQTAEEVARLRPHAIKIHNLYAVRGTPLADAVARGEARLMQRDEYVRAAVDFLERMPPHVVVERVGADAPPDYLVAPRWCLERSAVRIAVEAEFRRRGTRQGARWTPPAPGDPAPPDQPLPASDRATMEGALADGADGTPRAILDRIQASRRLPVLKLSP